jgi:hypothetical protein
VQQGGLNNFAALEHSQGENFERNYSESKGGINFVSHELLSYGVFLIALDFVLTQSGGLQCFS